jgi:hypothetical protein
MREHVAFLQNNWRQIAAGSLLAAGAMSGLMLLGAILA